MPESQDSWAGKSIQSLLPTSALEKIKVSVDVVNPSQFHNIGIEFWINDTKFFDNTVSTGRHHVIHEFNAFDGDHVMKIVMKNKTHAHTKIDHDGTIVADTLIRIENLHIDEINVDQLMIKLAQYHHDGNGSHDMKIHDFSGDLGCNGQVLLTFGVPVYLWLLENM